MRQAVIVLLQADSIELYPLILRLGLWIIVGLELIVVLELISGFLGFVLRSGLDTISVRV